MRALIAGLVVLLSASPAAASPASAAAKHKAKPTCAKKGSKTLRRGPGVRVFTAAARADGERVVRLYGCLSADGRKQVLSEREAETLWASFWTSGAPAGWVPVAPVRSPLQDYGSSRRSPTAHRGLRPRSASCSRCMPVRRDGPGPSNRPGRRPGQPRRGSCAPRALPSARRVGRKRRGGPAPDRSDTPGHRLRPRRLLPLGYRRARAPRTSGHRRPAPGPSGTPRRHTGFACAHRTSRHASPVLRSALGGSVHPRSPRDVRRRGGVGDTGSGPRRVPWPVGRRRQRTVRAPRDDAPASRSADRRGRPGRDRHQERQADRPDHASSAPRRPDRPCQPGALWPAPG